MALFDLPKSTEFGRVIPKNAFDEYTNSKQKKDIADHILRITWTHKISQETTNLTSLSIKEIQVFQIELKIKNDLKKIVDIIDKAIPYHIIFILRYEDSFILSTSAKHDHVSKANESVIDFTFKGKWIDTPNHSYTIELKESLDWTYIHFCNQLSSRIKEYATYKEFVESEIKIKELESKITSLESQIKREKQFNKKVKLNLELTQYRDSLENFVGH